MAIPVKSAVKDPKRAALELGRDLKRVANSLATSQSDVEALQQASLVYEIYRPKAFGIIETDGAGGVTLSASENIALAQISPTNAFHVEITLTLPMFGAVYPILVTEYSSLGIIPSVHSAAQTESKFEVKASPGGTSYSTTAAGFCFIVFGQLA